MSTIQASVPETVSYNDSSELEKSIGFVQFVIFVKEMSAGKMYRWHYLSTAHSTCVSQNQRMAYACTKCVPKNEAQRGKCSLGWFYGFGYIWYATTRARFSTSWPPGSCWWPGTSESEVVCRVHIRQDGWWQRLYRQRPVLQAVHWRNQLITKL